MDGSVSLLSKPSQSSSLVENDVPEGQSIIPRESSVTPSYEKFYLEGTIFLDPNNSLSKTLQTGKVGLRKQKKSTIVSSLDSSKPRQDDLQATPLHEVASDTLSKSSQSSRLTSSSLGEFTSETIFLKVGQLTHGLVQEVKSPASTEEAHEVKSLAFEEKFNSTAPESLQNPVEPKEGSMHSIALSDKGEAIQSAPPSRRKRRVCIFRVLECCCASGLEDNDDSLLDKEPLIKSK